MFKTEVVIFASDSVSYKYIKSFLKSKKFISVAGYLNSLNAAKEYIMGGQYSSNVD